MIAVITVVAFSFVILISGFVFLSSRKINVKIFPGGAHVITLIQFLSDMNFALLMKISESENPMIKVTMKFNINNAILSEFSADSMDRYFAIVRRL